MDGEAFLISAITAGADRERVRSAAAQPRGEWVAAMRSSSEIGTRLFADVTVALVLARMVSSRVAMRIFKYTKAARVAAPERSSRLDRAREYSTAFTEDLRYA